MWRSWRSTNVRWVLTTQTSPYTGMNNLANAYAALSDYRRTVVLHVEDLALRKRGLCADSHVALSMNNLANAFAALSNFKQAAALHVEVLSLAFCKHGC